jgi:hypothetical protein
MTVEMLAKATAQFMTELRKNGVTGRQAEQLATEFVKQHIMNEALGKLGPNKEPWEDAE